MSGPDDIDDLKQQVADLAALTAAMRRRVALTPGSPEWEDARDEEARLVEQVERWSRPRHETPPDDP